jgi:hypothetical protein
LGGPRAPCPSRASLPSHGAEIGLGVEEEGAGGDDRVAWSQARDDLVAIVVGSTERYLSRLEPTVGSLEEHQGALTGD